MMLGKGFEGAYWMESGVRFDTTDRRDNRGSTTSVEGAFRLPERTDHENSKNTERDANG